MAPLAWLPVEGVAVPWGFLARLPRTTGATGQRGSSRLPRGKTKSAVVYIFETDIDVYNHVIVLQVRPEPDQVMKDIAS